MATRQYIGARYVPKFADPIEWDNARSYEALEIVTYLNTSYTSKKPVPVGISISNSEYWVATGNYNAQVEAYRQEVQQLAAEVEGLMSAKKFLFIGDSYGAQQNNWVTVAASKLGLSSTQYYNASVSGIGFCVDSSSHSGSAYNGVLDVLESITEDRDTWTDIVICMGINDALDEAYSNMNFLDTHITTVISYIKENFPNAKPHIGFIGGALENSSVLYDRTYPKRCCALFGYIAGSSPYYLGGVENAIHQSKYCYGTDGLHPSEVGSSMIGQAVATAIINGSADLYQPPVAITLSSASWTVHDTTAKFEYKNDKCKLTINAAFYLTASVTSIGIETPVEFAISSSNLYVNKMYSKNQPIYLLLSDNNWVQVPAKITIEGNAIKIYPAQVSGTAGYQNYSAKMVTFSSDIVFEMDSFSVN